MLKIILPFIRLYELENVTVFFYFIISALFGLNLEALACLASAQLPSETRIGDRQLVQK